MSEAETFIRRSDALYRTLAARAARPGEGQVAAVGPRAPRGDAVAAHSGHTRQLVNWIRLDRARRHSRVVLDQPASDMPAFVGEAMDASGGTVTVMSRSNGDLLRAAGCSGRRDSSPSPWRL